MFGKFSIYLKEKLPSEVRKKTVNPVLLSLLYLEQELANYMVHRPNPTCHLHLYGLWA